MSNYTYGLDILEDALFRAGEDTTDSDYLAAAKDYVNRAYYQFLSVAPWPFAKQYPPGVIDTLAEETGTASISNGSTTITFDTGPDESMTDRKIYFDSDNTMYRITAHSSGETGATIDATLKETTKASASYTIFQDEYDLASDCMVPLRFWFRNNPERKIVRESDNTMFGRTHRSGLRPSRWAYINDSKVRFNFWTEDAKTIEYDYTYAPGFLDFAGTGSGDTPIIPLQHRPLLSDWALALLLKDKDDTRAKETIGDLNVAVRLLIYQYAPLMQPTFKPSRGNRIAP